MRAIAEFYGSGADTELARRINVKTGLTLTLVGGAMLLSHNTPAQSPENKAWSVLF